MTSDKHNAYKIFSGRVIIICPDREAGINALTDKVIGVTTSIETENEKETYLLIDLSDFSIVNSTFFGTLGSTIQLPYVKRVALCGMKGMVERTAKRFGIVDGKVDLAGVAEEITDNAQKFRIYDSLEKAVLDLIPAT